MNELVIRDQSGQLVTTSLLVAEKFHKRHDHVLRDISKLSCSQEFRLTNFGEHEYKDSRGNIQPMYYMTKDGFMFLTFGFNGRDAGELKERWIGVFNVNLNVISSQNAILTDDDKILEMGWEIMAKRAKNLEGQLVQAKEVIEKQGRRIEIAANRLESVAPKVEFTDRIHESTEEFDFKKVAKILQLPIGRNTLFKKLREEKVLMSNNEPYQSYIDLGYFVYKLKDTIECVNPKTNTPFIKKIYQTFVTGKGMYWLSKKYKGKNQKYKLDSTDLTIF